MLYILAVCKYKKVLNSGFIRFPEVFMVPKDIYISARCQIHLQKYMEILLNLNKGPGGLGS